MKSADFNRDGYLDLVTADAGANTVSVLLGRGDGTFSGRISYSVGLNPRKVSLGDFNGDGVLDLVSVDSVGDSLNVLLDATADGVAPLLDFSLSTQADAKKPCRLSPRKLIVQLSVRKLL